LPRLAQEAPKSVLRGGAATHKNRTANAIQNQNSQNLIQIIALLLVYRIFTKSTRFVAAKHDAKQHERRSNTYKMQFLCHKLNLESSNDDGT